MLGHFILDENHNVVPIHVWRGSSGGNMWMDQKALLRWGRFMESRAHYRVGESHVGPYWVSTVFLGMDHNWRIFDDEDLDPDYRPIVFETMVFERDNGAPKTLSAMMEENAKMTEADLADREDLRDEMVGVQWRYATWKEAEAGHAAAVRVCENYLAMVSAEIESTFEKPKDNDPAA